RSTPTRTTSTATRCGASTCSDRTPPRSRPWSTSPKRSALAESANTFGASRLAAGSGAATTTRTGRGSASQTRFGSVPRPCPGADTSGWDAWRLWDVYYRRLFSRRQTAGFLATLPAPDQLATFRWLFPESAVPQEKRNAYLFMRAALEEHAGQRSEALATYQSLRSAVDRGGQAATAGPLAERTTEAIARLSKQR